MILVQEWLQTPVDQVIDIAPLPDGDNEINLLDFVILSQDWMD